MSQQDKKQTKEPWKPKEKFDKKGNKEKNKAQETDAQIQQKEQKPEKSQKDKKDQQEEQGMSKQVIDDNNKLVQQNNRKDFTSHLTSYRMNTSTSIRNVAEIDSSVLHSSLLEMCMQFQSGKCMGSTYRCVEFLKAFKQFTMDFRMPKQVGKNKQTFGMVFNGYVEKIFVLIQQFRAVNEGMTTSYAYIRHLMTYLFHAKLDEMDQKLWLCQQIDVFIQQKIVQATELILKNAAELIQNNTKVLVYARSHLVESFILQCHQQGKNIQLFIVDNPPFNEGKQMMDRLTNEGVPCHYLLLSHVSYVINQIDKIFVGASALLCNGALISRVGTALLACIAHTHKKPFHVFCESYKFSEKSQIDSLSWNELAIPEVDSSNAKYRQMSLRYDVTQSPHINMVISEIGLIPPTSVKALIKEFKKYNYVDQIELPVKQQE